MATKKVKKYALGGRAFGQAPITNQPVRGPVGGGKPAPVNTVNSNVPRGPLPQATNPVRPVGGQARPPATGGLPAPGTGGRPPIGGQARPPAGNPAMMKKGGAVKKAAPAKKVASKTKKR